MPSLLARLTRYSTCCDQRGYGCSALLTTISERVARYLERQGRPAGVGWPSDEQSDYLTLAVDDAEGSTMKQLLRLLDHVPDSNGSTGRAQSADSLRCQLQTMCGSKRLTIFSDGGTVSFK
ncbi:MAG: hypothetical protein AB8B87_24200 [Granulosicoccus sp.]